MWPRSGALVPCPRGGFIKDRVIRLANYGSNFPPRRVSTAHHACETRRRRVKVFDRTFFLCGRASSPTPSRPRPLLPAPTPPPQISFHAAPSSSGFLAVSGAHTTHTHTPTHTRIVWLGAHGASKNWLVNMTSPDMRTSRSIVKAALRSP